VIGQTWQWGKLEKIARFEILENFSSVFQNGLAFLGQIGKARLSEFPEIYGLAMSTKISYIQNSSTGVVETLCP
jgi:hypothetical protein